MYVVNGWAEGSSVTTDANFYSFDDGASADPTQGAAAYTLYTIPLNEWFTDGDEDNNGLLGEGDAGWNTPSAVRAAEFKPGSVFTGKFLIPFAKKVGDDGHNAQTLQLQLVKGDGAAATDILRVWDIKLASTDPQVDPAQHVEYIDEETGTFKSRENNDEMTESYSLVRNHLYTVGAKATDEYDPDTDEPEDLSKGQNIILKVNDNWELIHKLVVD